MMKCCICSFLLLAAPLWAEDFTLANGSVLKDAEVLRQTTDSLQIRHAGGIEKFSYTELGADLQQKYDLTPEAVEARRQAAEEEAAQKRRAKEQAAAEKQRRLKEDQAARELALENAGKYARYISGAEVTQLCSGLLSVEARAAEFLAAEWNRREALRMQLELDAVRFSAEVDALRADFEEERRELSALRSELSDKRAQVQEKNAALKRKNEEIAALRAQVAQLNKALGRAEAENTQTTGTVVIDRPVYVPTYVPTYVGPPRSRPCPPQLPHRPARPAAPRPRPVQVSPGARPASSAHTLPRK